MIGSIEGKVCAARETHCVVVAGGVGYKIFATKDTLARCVIDTGVFLWIYTAVREDALDLYGFLDEDELRFFELLKTVSGIGPKSALGILDIAAAETLRSAIAHNNAHYLTSVSGIGKKTAEKIVLELKDKISVSTVVAIASGDSEALEAMRALGYSTHEAREALRTVPADIEGANDRLRAALRVVGSHRK
jgi:Holliday junction DNA helicase RuvA